MYKTEKNLQYKKSYFLNTYNQFPVEFVDGNGQYLYDSEGNEYLDMLSGIAVTSFGHKNPAIMNSAQEQMNKFWHVSNLFPMQAQKELAETLCERSGMEGVFFCNSGTEANEAAIKFSRLYDQSRFEIISALDSFHGRTMGSLSATGQYDLWKNFKPILPSFRFVPYGEIEAIEHSITSKTCAIMLEPIQGEGGINIPYEGYLKEVEQLCKKHDLLLIIDEIQTGMGRTGKLFAYQWENIQPDIVTVAKGIANGLPLGAVLCSEKVAEKILPGSHGSTFGGNPIACSAANTVLNLLTEEKLSEIEQIGEELVKKIIELNLEPIAEVRGKGLMIGIQLKSNYINKKVVSDLLKEGVITCAAGNNVVRLLPPFLLNKKDINLFIYTFKSVINSINIQNND